jgi:hypothetical protein
VLLREDTKGESIMGRLAFKKALTKWNLVRLLLKIADD